jgi:type II secretory pathway pseudopilin PulG
MGDASGFTLPELLVGAVLGLIVIGSGVSLFASGIRVEPATRDRAAQIQAARTMAERISRELRQGSNSVSADPSQLGILTYVPRTSCGGSTVGPAKRCWVFYDCEAAGTCSRTECPSTVFTPGPLCGAPVEVVHGLASHDVFAISPQIPGQAMVRLKLAFAAQDGEDAITIEDGVALRNPPLGGP